MSNKLESTAGGKINGIGEALRVLVTGAAGRIAYSLVAQICSGKAFGEKKHVNLILLDLEQMENRLKGLKMEIEDCCFEIVDSVTYTSKLEEAFVDLDYALLVGGFPRQPGMDRSDLLERNAPIFKAQGEALQKYSKPNVKVLVVANPANVNCMICMNSAPQLNSKNFMCLTALDANRLKTQVLEALPESERPKAENGMLNRYVTVFGDHSNTMVPHVDESSPLVNHIDSSVMDEIKKRVINRGAEVMNTQGASSALSAAKAICDHLNTWHNGTQNDEWATMGVFFDANPYGFEEQKGLISSAPVKVDSNGSWRFVEDVKIDEPVRTLITKSLQGIQEGYEMAMGSKSTKSA